MLAMKLSRNTVALVLCLAWTAFKVDHLAAADIKIATRVRSYVQGLFIGR